MKSLEKQEIIFENDRHLIFNKVFVKDNKVLKSLMVDELDFVVLN